MVVDDNVPTLSLTLAEPTVSEAAGADATTGTVSIASPASQPLTIALGSSDTTAATVPTSRRDRCRAGIRDVPDRGRR